MCSQVVQIHYLSLMNTLSDSLIFSRQSCNFTKGFNIDSLSQLVFWWSVKGRKQTFLQTKTDKIFWPQKVKVGSKDLINSIKKKITYQRVPIPYVPGCTSSLPYQPNSQISSKSPVMHFDVLSLPVHLIHPGASIGRGSI